MFYDKKVSVCNKIEGTKINGIYIPGKLQWVKDIYVDIQPYSTALLLKDYGYNIEVTKRIFADIDPNIKIGTTLKYNLKEYEVRKIIEWDDYIEVMCYGV